MVFVAAGINYKTAPLAIREKVALIADANTLHDLIRIAPMNEAIIISTCNRTEIYGITNNVDCILPWLCKKNNLKIDEIKSYFYIHQDENAVRHALTVASGLDSMMLGEPQILGQMKDAYQKSLHAKTIHSNLRQIFAYIFKTSKKIRTESGIGRNPISAAYAATQLIGKLFPDYASLNVLLIGSGETAALTAKHLDKKGVNNFMVAGRNIENTKRLANIFNGCALSITEISEYLPKADVVISATSCPLPFITTKMVKHAIEQRFEKPICLLDLAVPRDIEPEVKNISNTFLYNIDDLQIIAQEGMDKRQACAKIAEKIIDNEVENYIRWYNSLQAKEVLCDYRNHMQTLAHDELQRALQKLDKGECQYQVLSEFSERLVKKIIHTPTIGLKRVASDNRKELLDLANYIFKESLVTLQ